MGRGPLIIFFRKPDTFSKNNSNHYCNKSTKERLKVRSVGQPCPCNDINEFQKVRIEVF